jgi:predicted RNA methylase
MKTEKKEILQKCTVEGMIVRLPEIKLDRKEYLEVAKSLELIGGKWKGGKIGGFIFNEDPTELLSQIAVGESRNIKKEIQFFATPNDLAEELVELAFLNARIVGKVLEPSAGQGSIINAIHKLEFPHLTVRYCEINEINKTLLKKIPHTEYLCDNFLDLNMPNEFATIIANPPFSKNQDIDHILKMYECIKPGGRIATIASKHWQFSNNKKEVGFRNWLHEVKAEIHDVDKGTFKSSRTMIGTVIIVINKQL